MKLINRFILALLLLAPLGQANAVWRIYGEYLLRGESHGGVPSNYIWNDPSVLLVNGQLTMFASAGTDRFNVSIYRLLWNGRDWDVQNNGLPVLSKGAPGEFDSINTETPSVIRVGNMLHMYYSAAVQCGPGQVYTMGHAVADVSNPDLWFKMGEVTTLTSNICQLEGNPWGWAAAAEPGALHIPGVGIILYFTEARCRTGLGPDGCEQAPGLPPTVHGISLGISTPHMNEAYGHAFIKIGNEPVLKTGGKYQPENGWEGFSTPQPHFNNGFVDLYVDAARYRPATQEAFSQEALAVFRSTNGINFSILEEDIMTNDQMPGWGNRQVVSPSVILVGKTLLMWFAGRQSYYLDGPDFGSGIGLATRPNYRLETGPAQ